MKKFCRFLCFVTVVAVSLTMVACGADGGPTGDTFDALTLDQVDQDMPGTDDGTGGDAVGDMVGDTTDNAADDAVMPDFGQDDGSPDATDDVSVDVAGDAVVDAADAVEDIPVVPDPALYLRDNGWLIGDLHMHSTYSDGEDSVAVVVGLAEYFQHPDFLAFHPEYQGFSLDFIALTDHRTAEQNQDPAFVSDKLVLIPGQEFGSPGHANLFGVTGTVDHNPDGGIVTLENYRDGLDAAGAMGAVRSINHPYTTGIYFPWDVHNYESMEIWNVKWAVSQPGATQDSITEWETAKKATANTIYRKAAEYQGIGGNAQSLKFYEALLSRGHHIALVGGSDRHTVFDLGFPATWVSSATRDMSGILDAIRARHTFVNRTPVGATIEMIVDDGQAEYVQGDQIPISNKGQDVTITIRVTRAAGGRLMVFGGHRIASDDALAGAEMGVMDLDEAIDSNDFQKQMTVTVYPGDWFYPVVWEKLVPDGLDPELAAQIPDIAATVATIRDEDYSPLIGALFPFVDDLTFMTPDQCKPATWKGDITQCMPPDNNGMATIMLPDWIDRVLNVVVEGGVSSNQWTMGAVASAVLFAYDGSVE